eukprot:jgi/Psemu1/320998/estExt_fgenesh1_pm.C_10540003
MKLQRGTSGVRPKYERDSEITLNLVCVTKETINKSGAKQKRHKRLKTKFNLAKGKDTGMTVMEGNSHTQNSVEGNSKTQASINEDENDSDGHLEVSLKHSGSLVLWSGSTRYYSKNSACNQFSRTAEILLRQRFEAVRRALASKTETETHAGHHPMCSYDDCSRFVAENRYTVALEVVAGEVLGDHGQIPNRDYVVVTAVADRTKESFLSTSEVLEFCHRFRLPHNDVWTFVPSSLSSSLSSSSSPSSAEALFRLYDGSLRETGDTETTVRRLTEIADVYVPSPIPHSIYQGSICEGFIVRYVEDDDDHDAGQIGNKNTHITERDRLEGLARTARDILREIPPSAVASPMDVDGDGASETETETAAIDSVLTTDIRRLYRSIVVVSSDAQNTEAKNDSNNNDGNDAAAKTSKKSLSGIALERERADLFSKRLEALLSADSGNDHQVKRRRKLPQRYDLVRLERQPGANDACDGAGKTNVQNHHLPALTRSLVNSGDRETKRIAALLQTLDNLKGGAVTYSWMEKYDDEHHHGTDGDGSGSGNRKGTPRKRRLYCIIHVHQDSTFFKFQRLQDPSDMTLFRGFCVEVLLDDNDAREVNGTAIDEPMESITVEQKGPEEFERIAQGLLEKWKVSTEAQDRWMPFFRGWATYVMECKSAREAQDQKSGTPNGTPNDNAEKGPSSHSTYTRDGSALGPLTNFSYLRHLEHYTKLYNAGKFLTTTSAPTLSSTPESHTFVCVVSHSTEISHAVANDFADRFSKPGTSDDPASAKSTMTVCSLGEACQYRRSQSCIAYANVCDQTKGIKKFLNDKKVSKHSILVLLVSDRQEITALTQTSDESEPPTWLDIANQEDSKKFINMWRLWNKLPCAKRIAIGQADIEVEPRGENTTEAVLSELKGAEEILDSIRTVGRARIEQQQSNSGPSGGILVFFPGIPGCGKSSLLESLEPKLAEKLLSHKTKDGDAYDRSVHIKEGDKIGKKFWDIVEDLVYIDDNDDRRRRSPPLVVADKNAPPASWSKLGQIRSVSRGSLLPVLPDRTGLETTVIEGSITPTGSHDPSVSHFYPFSLNYLAVSLSRVLNRPPGEHAGKLDSGFPLACMVVVQFYAFYRYIAADSLLEKLEEKSDKDCLLTKTTTILKPIELPFLNESASTRDIPDDLKQLLVEAIQLRHGHDKGKKFKVKKDDAQLIDLEGRLRECLENHKSAVDAMSVTLDRAKNAFISQMLERMSQLTGDGVTRSLAETNISQTNIKLVSLDIDRTSVHELLQKHRASEDLKAMFERITPRAAPSTTDNVDKDGTEAVGTTNEVGFDGSSGFVEKTHVTMAFAGEQQSSDELLSKFRHLQGRCVAVTVTGCLWSKTHAALQVHIATSSTTVGKTGEDYVPIPPCENAFVHMTIWFAPGYRASGANELPGLVASGAAHRVDFVEAETLVGTLSFWNHSNEPIQLL